MSARNVDSLERRLTEILNDLLGRVRRLERRRPTGTGGGGGGVCDCEDGTDGQDGQDGADGAPGVGVPTGGTAGQSLLKASGTDYDTGWGEPDPPELELDNLTDVDTSGEADNDILKYNFGSNTWFPGHLFLDELIDVDVTSPTDGDVLTYNNGTTTWEAAAPTGGSGSSYPATGLQYQFNTSNSVADPGDGHVGYDDVAGLATKLVISGTDINLIDWDIVIPTWDDSTSTVKGTLSVFHDATPASRWAVFEIVSLTTHVGWFEFTVNPVQDAGALPANDAPVTVVFSRTGDKGATGSTGATGATGADGTTATSIVAYAEATGTQTGISAVTDITGATVTFTAVAGRQYEISGFVAVVNNSGSNAHVILYLTDGSNTQIDGPVTTVPNGTYGELEVHKVITPGAGSKTYKLRAATSGGSVDMNQSASSPTTILVKDLTGGATTGEVTTASPLGAPGTPNLLRSYKGVMFMDTGNYWWPMGGAMEQIAYEWTHFFNNNAQKAELQSSVSGGAANAGTASAGNQGVLSLSTSTSSTGRAGYAAGQSSALRGTADKLMHFHTRVRFPTLSTSSERYYFTAGFLSSMTGVPGDGFYFRYEEAVNANWYCVVVNNATGTAGTNSGVAVATNNFQKLRIEVDEPNVVAKFYIADSLVATINTNFPGTTRDFGPAINMRKTVGTTDRTCDVDYVGYWSLMTSTV